MEFAEEQQFQEIEALESMYSNELSVLCRDFPRISVELAVRPDADCFAELFGKNCVTLRATFPKDYPNCFPEIGLPDFEEENEENNQQRSHFWEECARTVKEELDKAMEENVGMPMLFTLIGTLQDFFVRMAENHLKVRDELERQKAEQIEREEQARFEGTKVTTESFKEWNGAFLNPIRTQREKSKQDNLTTKRMTGKQLFLSDKSLNISDLQFLDKSESAVEIDQSLFEDEIDFDEDDDDGDYNPEAGEEANESN